MDKNVSQKPKVKLIGTDGNVFSLIGKVSAALKKVGQKEKAVEFAEKAFGAEDYDHVLQIIMEYVEVE